MDGSSHQILVNLERIGVKKMKAVKAKHLLKLNLAKEGEQSVSDT